MTKRIYILSIALLSVMVLFSACGNTKIERKKDTVSDNKVVTGSVEVTVDNITENPKVGDLIKLPVYLNTHTSPVTSLQLLFNYNQDMLEFDSVSTLASKFTIWIKKDGGNGQVNLVTAEPKPGIIGENELVGTMVFKVKTSGETDVVLDSNLSKLFTADDINAIRSEGHKNAHIVVVNDGLDSEATTE